MHQRRKGADLWRVEAVVREIGTEIDEVKGRLSTECRTIYVMMSNLVIFALILRYARIYMYCHCCHCEKQDTCKSFWVAKFINKKALQQTMNSIPRDTAYQLCDI